MRNLLIAIGIASAAVVSAQVPDVRFKIDATLSFRTEKGNPPVLKAYSVLGRHSTVGLTFFTEPGFRIYVSQKLQKFSGEVDEEPLEEYYIEDEGIWRVGKQFVPFGTGNMLRESVLAARADTNLIFERFPVSVAVMDGGTGGQRGATARVGTRVGASIAVGRHLGIASTALWQIRNPEDSPGNGFGFETAVGLDYTTRFHSSVFVLEGIALRRGETPADKDLTLADASFTYNFPHNQNVGIGWSRILPSGGDVFRITGSFQFLRSVSLEPVLRYRNQKLYDAAIELRIRL